MSLPFSSSRMLQASVFAACLTLAAGTANAQSAKSPDSASPAASTSESSSSAAFDATGAPEGSAALPAAPGAPAAQEGGYGRSGYHGHSTWSHLEWEAGGGFNSPTPDSSPYITFGGNFTVGAGYRFNPRFSTNLEYQFIDSKLPGALIAETGANGGYDHIWSLTVAPVFDLFPKSSNDVYVTGGGGFYRKVTSFTDVLPSEYCTYFYCGVGYSPQVVGHFSSNQGGWNIGAGYQHRLGGMYGDSKTRIFAEARYLDVLSPSLTTQPNGLGTTTVGEDTKIIPVTFGIKF